MCSLKSFLNLILPRYAMIFLLGTLTLISSTSFTFAADICTAIALTKVPDWGDGYPQDASGSALEKGEMDSAVTQYLVNKKTGDAVFCSHGGYCYPRYLTINGQKIEALRLTNCKIGARESAMPGITDDNETYDVDVDRPKNSSSSLVYDDIDNACWRWVCVAPVQETPLTSISRIHNRTAVRLSRMHWRATKEPLPNSNPIPIIARKLRSHPQLNP